MNSNISSEHLISLANVRKEYKIFQSPQHRLWEALIPFGGNKHSIFQALDTTNLKIERGETVGIVGRNGSGKSTLLKIVAGVLSPTEGTVSTHGRVSALLELGAGFDPELTGRNNAILSGIIQGIGQKETEKKIYEIEAFSGIGEFFDRPVKTYSSGMFVRLAFSVATAVEPDVLIVDEAIAVGDAIFQQQCFERIRKLQSEESAVLLVTHDPGAILNICSRCILMEGGRVIADGEPANILAHYHELLSTGHVGAISIPNGAKKNHPLTAGNQNGSVLEFEDMDTNANTTIKHKKNKSSIEDQRIIDFIDRGITDDICHLHANYNPQEYRFGDRRATIVDYGIFSRNGANTSLLFHDEIVDLVFTVRINQRIDNPIIGYSVKRVDGLTLAGVNTRHMDLDLEPFADIGSFANFLFKIHIPFAPADLFFELGVADKLADSDQAADIRKNLFTVRVGDPARYEGVVGVTQDFFQII